MKPARILIVDDNKENLYLLRSLLQGGGFEVDEAHQGAEALVRARKSPPDLVVSDILMPVMDGFTLCREWKKDGSLRQIPFIFYTATDTDARDKEFALSLGAERFIVKPEEPEALLAVFRETLRQRPAPPAPAVRQPAEAPDAEEAVFLKQHNEALIRKLEDKMTQLEQAKLRVEREAEAQLDADRALRHERDFSDTVLNSLPGVFFCDDGALHAFRWNKNLERITGYTPTEIADMTPMDFVAAQDRDTLKRQIRQVFEKGVSEVEVDLVTKDGAHIPFYFTGTAADIDGRRCLVGVGVDISARKRAKAQVQEQMDELRRWNKVMLDRETRNLELKREVNELLAKMGQPARYASALPNEENNP